MMESNRQQITGCLVQKNLSQVFLKNGVSLYGHALVTVTMVRMNVDLSVAKVYISVLGNKTQLILDKLNSQKGQIRYFLGTLLAKKVKNIPELYFYYDDSVD